MFENLIAKINRTPVQDVAQRHQLQPIEEPTDVVEGDRHKAWVRARQQFANSFNHGHLENMTTEQQAIMYATIGTEPEFTE